MHLPEAVGAHSEGSSANRLSDDRIPAENPAAGPHDATAVIGDHHLKVAVYRSERVQIEWSARVRDTAAALRQLDEFVRAPCAQPHSVIAHEITHPGAPAQTSVVPGDGLHCDVQVEPGEPPQLLGNHLSLQFALS